MRIHALLLAATLISFGCAADEMPALTLVGFHGLEAEEDGCTRSEDQRSFAQYDTGLATTYGQPLSIYLHLRNELDVRANEQIGQVEANRIEVRSMRVSFEGEGWSTLPEPIVLPLTGVIVGPGEEYWKHAMPIPATLAEVFHDQLEGSDARELRLRIGLEGTTLDGEKVKSNELSHLVYMCKHCIGCPIGHVMVAACAMASAQNDGLTCEEVEDVPEF